MYQAPMIGRATRKTVAGATVLATLTASPTVGGINLIGIMTHATVTGNTIVQLWAGVTATSTAAGTPITGLITFVSATATGVKDNFAQFMPVPAYCSGGLCINTSGDNTDITLFWNPASG